MDLRRAATVIGLSLAAIGSASGCGRGAATAATVNGRAIARADFEREVTALRGVPDPDGAGAPCPHISTAERITIAKM